MVVVPEYLTDTWPMTSSRFNAHMTFNLLNTIQGLLLEERADQASDLITRYSRILRQMLVNGTMIARVKDEMTTIADYLEIERARSNNGFTFHIDLDPTLSELHVPKSLLACLLENALKHGIRPMGGRGSIVISGKRGIAGKDRNNSSIIIFTLSNSAPPDYGRSQHSSERRHGFELLNDLNEAFYEATGQPVAIHITESDTAEGFRWVSARVVIG
jgi:LytS/YehU family sensor histidine kinase